MGKCRRVLLSWQNTLIRYFKLKWHFLNESIILVAWLPSNFQLLPKNHKITSNSFYSLCCLEKSIHFLVFPILFLSYTHSFFIFFLFLIYFLFSLERNEQRNLSMKPSPTTFFTMSCFWAYLIISSYHKYNSLTRKG